MNAQMGPCQQLLWMDSPGFQGVPSDAGLLPSFSTADEGSCLRSHMAARVWDRCPTPAQLMRICVLSTRQPGDTTVLALQRFILCWESPGMSSNPRCQQGGSIGTPDCLCTVPV